MKSSMLFLGVATLGITVYHLGQKAIPAGSNPMVVLMAAYGVAFALSAAAMPFFQTPGGPTWQAVLLDRGTLALALGAFLIELGFLLAYRTGASLQTSGLVVNGLAAVALLPLAFLLHRESLSWERATGVVLTLVGMGLMLRK